MALRKRHIGLMVLGALVAAVVLLVVLWDWNWFRPMVEARASSALGRRVTIANLHVALGRVTEITADDIAIADPADFPEAGNFATIGRLAVQVDVMAYVRQRVLVLPHIEVDRANVEAKQLASGAANWNFKFGSSSSGSSTQSSSPGPQIRDLAIHDGHVHVTSPKLKADVTLAVETTPGPTGEDGRITADAKGTYSGQPVTGHFVGGALLTLRDNAHPYPVDLHAANGPTHISLVGTIQDPLALAGVDLKLDLAGPDMELLFPLTGIPIPQTPPYEISGKLDYADRKIKFQHFTGRVGSSDLNGDIAVDPGRERPLVIADLNSKRVDLADLGGFIGSTPGRASTPGESPAQRQQTARAEASPKLLPSTPINLPKVRAADVQLKYKGAHILGRSMPLDDVVANLTITDGNIELAPLSFGVGRGQIASTISLAEKGDEVHARAKIDFRQVDLSRLMESTHLVHGAGLIGGSADIDSTGKSLAQLMGQGNGGVRLYMSGGDLSALLVDLSGLEFGNALLSALGMPSKAQVKCMITDLALVHGVLQTKIMAVDTTEADIHVTGEADLRNETLHYQLKTEATHFTVGSLPTAINVAGTFKSPSVRPDLVELGARAGAAVGLGILFPPLALLPTIQLGLGEKNDCQGFVQRPAAGKPAAKPPAKK